MQIETIEKKRKKTKTLGKLVLDGLTFIAYDSIIDQLGDA